MSSSTKMSDEALNGCRLNPERSFTLSLRPHECAFLEGLLIDARRSSRLEGQGLGESFSLKVRPYEHTLLEGLLRGARRPFVLDGRGQDLGESFTLTIRPYEYEMLPRQAVVVFAVFLPLHTGAVHFDQGKNIYMYRPDRGISEFIHHDSCRKAVEGPASTHLYPLQGGELGGELKGWVSPLGRGWGGLYKPANTGPASYAYISFALAQPNRKERFGAVPCCCRWALSLRQSSWVDLHMLKRYLL